MLALAIVFSQVWSAQSQMQYNPESNIATALEDLDSLIDRLVKPDDKTQILKPRELAPHTGKATCATMGPVVGRLKLLSVFLAAGEVQREAKRLGDELDETAQAFCSLKAVPSIPTGVPSTELITRLERIRARLDWASRKSLTTVKSTGQVVQGYVDYSWDSLAAARARMVDADFQPLARPVDTLSTLKMCYRLGYATFAANGLEAAQKYVYQSLKRPVNAQCDSAIARAHETIDQITDGFCYGVQVKIDVKPGQFSDQLMKLVDRAQADLLMVGKVCPKK